MPNDLQLSDQDEVLLESLVLAASDNVTRAPGADRSQFAPTRRRVFVETDGNENVYLGTGNAWVDVSENTGLLSSLFGGGDGNFDSVNTGETTLTDNIREQATAIDTDTDDSNALDLSLSGLNDTRAQTVYLDLNGSGDGPVDLKIQVNNDTTTVYDYVIQNTTNTTHTTGDTAFRANYVGGRDYFFVFDIGNPRSGGSPKPTISQRTQADNRDRIVQGRYNTSDTVSSIQITTANGINPNATGIAAVIEEEIL